MSFDVVSYLMGQAAGGGGSGAKQLWGSGWINTYDSYVEIDGNTITMKSGSTSHSVNIGPPAEYNHDRRFVTGDTLKIAITVKAVDAMVGVYMDNGTGYTVSSATGLFTISNKNAKATQAGSDVLTFSRTASYGQLWIKPYSDSGSASADASATVEVTGMEYNGTLIYGSVTPPNS